ncbi:phage baseplate assembly protein [Pseudoduganella violaceinigra]|uniref:phage baseplate assembly protein n=1 Tax=Pseudoduganella violaceinigra TaxID=246602 RepID=UPI000555CBC7|nr:contractile injection system protein, VgrG/Pvc8 family [Pseudoduganella violaceinigra]
MMNDNKLTLHVGGQVYGGWKIVNVRHGIEQIAGTFEIALTERWPDQQTAWAIPPGEFCEVRIGAHVVINGYVDSVNVSYDSNDHRIQIKGRDKTGDLVDCSAPSQAYSGLTGKQIADRLCAPFGIKVYDETTSAKKPTGQQEKSGKTAAPPDSPRVEGCLPKFACQNGETVFRALERLARNEAVLLVSDHEGGLLLTRAGRAGRIAVPLEFGKNVLSANLEMSHANLFSEITVKGQASAQEVDDVGKLEAVISSKTTVKRAANGTKTGNSQITRYRPLIVVCESQADAARIRQRAEWEVGNREAKARKYVATVQGWYPDPMGDDIWRINSMVRVVDRLSRIDEEWLVAAITFKLDEGGTTAEIELTSPKAFDQLPEIPEPKPGAKDAGSKFERA